MRLNSADSKTCRSTRRNRCKKDTENRYAQHSRVVRGTTPAIKAKDETWERRLSPLIVIQSRCEASKLLLRDLCELTDGSRGNEKKTKATTERTLYSEHSPCRFAF